MSDGQMLAIYMRLRQDLADAYSADRWNEGLLNRLTSEISTIEHALAKRQPQDEQTSEMLPQFAKVAFSENRA